MLMQCFYDYYLIYAPAKATITNKDAGGDAAKKNKKTSRWEKHKINIKEIVLIYWLYNSNK